MMNKRQYLNKQKELSTRGIITIGEALINKSYYDKMIDIDKSMNNSVTMFLLTITVVYLAGINIAVYEQASYTLLDLSFIGLVVIAAVIIIFIIFNVNEANRQIKELDVLLNKSK